MPIDRPFTLFQARREGVDRRLLAGWLQAGMLVHPLAGVYYAAQLTDSLELRIQCLNLTVPDDAVITDRTAAWLHGAPMALAPGDHLRVPQVSVFRRPGYRLRNALASSGERRLAQTDVMEVGGLRVTVPLRTACDLGRLLRRDQALGALDLMLRLREFGGAELMDATRRFKGYRGVTQLRALAPLADRRAESPGESILRLRWLDCGNLPAPTPQLEVPGPDGSYFLDLGVMGLRYAAEYDGAEWHGPERRQHDAVRRAWVSEQLGFEIDVFKAANIHGIQQDAETILTHGIARARMRRGGHQP